jgi:hypothetical protein
MNEDGLQFVDIREDDAGDVPAPETRPIERSSHLFKGHAIERSTATGRIQIDPDILRMLEEAEADEQQNVEPAVDAESDVNADQNECASSEDEYWQDEADTNAQLNNDAIQDDVQDSSQEDDDDESDPEINHIMGIPRAVMERHNLRQTELESRKMGSEQTSDSLLEHDCAILPRKKPAVIPTTEPSLRKKSVTFDLPESDDVVAVANADAQREPPKKRAPQKVPELLGEIVEHAESQNASSDGESEQDELDMAMMMHSVRSLPSGSG